MNPSNSRKRGNIESKLTKRKKQKEEDTSSSSSSEECETYLSDESSEENASGSKNLTWCGISWWKMLKNFWESLSPPACKSDVLNKWFACVYQMKNKPRLFIGKLIKWFLRDKNGPIAALSIDYLKLLIGSGNILGSVPPRLPSIIGVFPFQDIFYEPIEVLPMKNGRWSVPELPKIRCFWNSSNHWQKQSQAFYASQQSNES